MWSPDQTLGQRRPYNVDVSTLACSEALLRCGRCTEIAQDCQLKQGVLCTAFMKFTPTTEKLGNGKIRVPCRLLDEPSFADWPHEGAASRHV